MYQEICQKNVNDFLLDNQSFFTASWINCTKGNRSIFLGQFLGISNPDSPWTSPIVQFKNDMNEKAHNMEQSSTLAKETLIEYNENALSKFRAFE